MNIKPVRTSWKSPWQNGVAERWVGNIRRDLLDHVIVVTEKHLRGLAREYASYYNHDRCHYALNKDAPNVRPVQFRPSRSATIEAIPKLGGLHHRYQWRDAA
jgi:transposase InsO family protein